MPEMRAYCEGEMKRNYKKTWKMKGVLIDAYPEKYQALNTNGVQWILKIKRFFIIKTVKRVFPYGKRIDNYIGKKVKL